MKYTVLVVDDEHDQRKALIEHVDWTSAGFEVIGEAENGVEAFDLLETLEPDLILTDIRMPMISGLELAARVREIRPATQVVILSGYDSFEYAQTAINYNIISYLLKPISPYEMSNELAKIHKRMDERFSVASGEHGTGTKEQLRELSVDNFLLPLMLGSNEERLDDSELFNTARELGIINEKQLQMLRDFKKDQMGSMKQFLIDHPEFLEESLNSDNSKTAKRAKLLVEQDLYELNK